MERFSNRKVCSQKNLCNLTTAANSASHPTGTVSQKGKLLFVCLIVPDLTKL